MGIEPTSSAWKADILADVLYPQLQKALYHNFPQMSSMNLGAARLGRYNKKAPHISVQCFLFLVEITGPILITVTSCMPCKRSPEPP